MCLFVNRMCYDSMNIRAALYNHVTQSKIEDEVLVLMKKRSKLSKSAVNVNIGLTADGVDGELWHWVPVVAVIRSNSSMLQLYQVTAEYEDAREAYIQALILSNNGTGQYERVKEL